MNLYLQIGQKIPKMSEGTNWHIQKDLNGNILSAQGCLKGNYGQTLDIFVKKTNNGCTKVKREFSIQTGRKEISSLFDANGKLIHCSVYNNGKLIEFTRSSFKKLKSYELKPNKAIKLIKKLLLKK